MESKFRARFATETPFKKFWIRHWRGREREGEQEREYERVRKAEMQLIIIVSLIRDNYELSYNTLYMYMSCHSGVITPQGGWIPGTDILLI
jgi:hypothetical protein